MELFSKLWKDFEDSRLSIFEVVEQILRYEKNWKMNLTTIPKLKEKVRMYVLEIVEFGMEETLEKLILK